MIPGADPSLEILLAMQGVVSDLSGKGRHGTWVGTPAYTDGPFGRAAVQDATNYVTLPTDMLSGTLSLTFCALARNDGSQAGLFYADGVDDPGSTALNYIRWFISGGNALRLVVRDADGSAGITGSADVGSGWQFLASSINSDTKEIRHFANGFSAGGGTNTRGLAIPSGIGLPWRIGRNFASGGGSACGPMQRIAVYSGVLGDDELRSVGAGFSRWGGGP